MIFIILFFVHFEFRLFPFLKVTVGGDDSLAESTTPDDVSAIPKFCISREKTPPELSFDRTNMCRKPLIPDGVRTSSAGITSTSKTHDVRRLRIEIWFSIKAPRALKS